MKKLHSDDTGLENEFEKDRLRHKWLRKQQSQKEEQKRSKERKLRKLYDELQTM